MSNIKKWSLKEVPNLQDKVVVITGANRGIGFEAATIFAQHKATVIIACRDIEKGQQAVEKLRGKNPSASIQLMKLDLASLKSIKDFVQEFTHKYSRIDILVNNAGVMMTPQIKTQDGFDLQFGINHLGHFALTSLLFDILKKTKGSRIVTMSSTVHATGKIYFEDVNWTKRKDFTPYKAYEQSKLANIMFAYELDREIKQHNLDMMSIAVHPGFAKTNLQATGLKMGKGIQTRLFRLAFFIAGFFAQSAKMGCLPIIMASTSDQVTGGEYIGPNKFGQNRGYPEKVTSSELSHNAEIATKLWNISETLTGTQFSFS